MVLLLSACGFKLKGTQIYDHLPVQNWQVSGDVLQIPLEKAMRRALTSANNTVNNQAAEIRVLRVDTKKDVYTITRAAKLNEYLLSMSVHAQAFRDGKAWGEPMYIEIRRTLPYADSMILGKAEEEQMIWNEMKADAAEQIIQRLTFLPNE